MLSSMFKRESYFLSQPHQPFFLIGTVWAICAMLLFALSYHGVLLLSIPSSFFHVYSMIFMIFTPFFTGFIFTTFPRFCQSDTIDKRIYSQIFYVSQIGSIIFVIGALTNIVISMIGMLLLLSSHIMIVMQLQKIYRSGLTSRSSSDPFWILIGFYFGIFAHILFILESTFMFFNLNMTIFPIIAALGFWNYLIFVAFAVAQRMVPFFSHVMTEKRYGFTATVFGALVLKTLLIMMTMKWLETFVDTGLGIYLLIEYRRWKLHTFKSPAILWVLHLALYWIPAALLFGAFSNIIADFTTISASFLELHLMAIGFLTTLLIGFGTRVTLGHSGQPPHADRYATNIFWFIQAVVVFRGAYAFYTSELWLFDLSATAWILLYLFWTSRFASVLIRGKKIS